MTASRALRTLISTSTVALTVSAALLASAGAAGASTPTAPTTGLIPALTCVTIPDVTGTPKLYCSDPATDVVYRVTPVGEIEIIDGAFAPKPIRGGTLDGREVGPADRIKSIRRTFKPAPRRALRPISGRVFAQLPDRTSAPVRCPLTQVGDVVKHVCPPKPAPPVYKRLTRKAGR